MGCIFCNKIEERQILFETKHFKAIYDIDPIQFGHMLVMTKEHKLHISDLSQTELNELMNVQREVIKVMEKTLVVDGVSIIMNNGGIMDSGIHFHIHLIPRSHGDDFWTHQQVVEKPIDVQLFRARLRKEFTYDNSSD